jgi:hypothetical protein
MIEEGSKLRNVNVSFAHLLIINALDFCMETKLATVTELFPTRQALVWLSIGMDIHMFLKAVVGG